MTVRLEWPSVEVPASADLPRMVAEAGGSDSLYAEGRLYVADTTQAALDAALATVGIEPAPPPVPLAITPLQTRKGLRAAGMLPQVLAAVAAADDETQDAWEYALEVRRDDPMLTTIGAALGLDDAQIDNLFRAAAAL